MATDDNWDDKDGGHYEAGEPDDSGHYDADLPPIYKITDPKKSSSKQEEEQRKDKEHWKLWHLFLKQTDILPEYRRQEFQRWKESPIRKELLLLIETQSREILTLSQDKRRLDQAIQECHSTYREERKQWEKWRQDWENYKKRVFQAKEYRRQESLKLEATQKKIAKDEQRRKVDRDSRFSTLGVVGVIVLSLLWICFSVFW